MTMIYCIIVCMSVCIASLVIMSDNVWMYIRYGDTDKLHLALTMLAFLIASVIGFWKCYIELFGL